jgi:hypothetical protein
MRQGSMHGSAQHDRLLFLVEQLQRQGKSEQEINERIDEAIAEQAAAQQSA